MAENRLETRILLRYGTYTQWMNSDVILMRGEAAICSFPRDNVIDGLSDDSPDATPPAIGIKIGDGKRYFSQLPWVQGIAADVYAWAKQSRKPTYTAQEIQGLQSYVENIAGTSTDVTIAPRIYQLVQGTGLNASKYYLRYKENNEDSEWITDTSVAIDLTSLVALYNWVGQDNLDEYLSLTVKNATQIQYFINQLNETDAAITNQFVTSVSESNGHIHVTRAQPTFSNLDGYASVSQGGTGRTSLTQDSILVGNGENEVKLVPIASELDESNSIPTNRIIKQYVDNATSGVTGAMHYVGEASAEITNNSRVNPRIDDYNFSNAKAGDVVTYDAKEFVWTGSNWRLLGDEGSYAVKGSITNADIADEANIAQDKIYNLVETLEGKVDVVEGKQLSTNDYSDDDKYKLDHIEENAQENVIEHIYLNDNELPVITYDGNQKSVRAVINEFDAASQTKLENIEAGAQVNVIEAISLNGKNQPPEDKRVSLTVSEFDDTSREKLAGIQAGAQVNVIEQVYVNGTEILPNGKRLDIPISQLTPEQAAKLNAIEDGAQVNVIEHIKVDDAELAIENKTVTIKMPQHLDHVNKIESIALNGTVVQPDNNKQVALNLDDVYKEQLAKLNGIQEGAQVNTIESIALNGTTLLPDNNGKVDIGVREITTDERAKLASVQYNAEENIIQGFTLNNTPITPDSNRVVNIEVRGFTSAELDKLNSIPANAQENVIEEIVYDGEKLNPTNKTITITPNHHPEHENVFEHIYYGQDELEPDGLKAITIPAHPEYENTVETIYYDGLELIPDARKRVYITPDHHPEHENVIEKIYINGQQQTVYETDKSVRISITQRDLNLDVISGAEVPPSSGTTKEEVPEVDQKLQLSRISLTGNVEDLKQTNDTYIILDCGSSTELV